MPANAVLNAFLLTVSSVFHLAATSARTSSNSLNSKLEERNEIPILFKTVSTSFNLSAVSPESSDVFNKLYLPALTLL